MSRRKDHDIKAPDGFLLGGLRKVRRDGTVLFQRDYWACPSDWIGEQVWVHCLSAGDDRIEAWPPGVPVFTHKASVLLPGTDRVSAKPGYRNSVYKAWAARGKGLPA